MFGLLNTIKNCFRNSINVHKERQETLSELTNTLKETVRKVNSRRDEQETSQTTLERIFTSWAKSPEGKAAEQFLAANPLFSSTIDIVKGTCTYFSPTIYLAATKQGGFYFKEMYKNYEGKHIHNELSNIGLIIEGWMKENGKSASEFIPFLCEQIAKMCKQVEHGKMF